MNIFKKITKGFTLLETLASVTVLSLVVIGPLSVTISSSGYARLTKDTIVATYLAEEAVELLQNQYDSLYIYCKKNASSTEPGGYCDPDLVGAVETTTGQAAWRLFKNKLSSAGGGPTCFLPKGDDPGYTGDSTSIANGCAFDYIHLQASSTQDLVRHDASSDSCKYLVPVSTSTRRYVPNTIGGGQFGGNGNEINEDDAQGTNQEPPISYSFVTSTSTSYVCSGEPARTIEGSRITSKEYVRSITVDQIPTFETDPANQQYNDDLRVTSNVTFKALNGMSHTVKITRFMHARP